MRYFEVPNADINLLDEETIEWIRLVGDTITEPAWTIRPYKLSAADLERITPLTSALPVKPSYAAIIMVEAGTICKTHIDNIGGRISALNIGIQVDNDKSFFDYMDGDTVIERLRLDVPKLWAVDVPHRVDNSLYDKNRVVLSLSYQDTVGDLYERF